MKQKKWAKHGPLLIFFANKTIPKVKIRMDKHLKGVMPLLGQKKWSNVVLLDSYKDATLIGRAEELPDINYGFPEDIFPLNMELPEKRTKIGALIKSLQYSRMGLYNLIVKS